MKHSDAFVEPPLPVSAAPGCVKISLPAEDNRNKGLHVHGSECRQQQAGHAKQCQRQPHLDVPQGQHPL